MAKKVRRLVKLESPAGTGYFYLAVEPKDSTKKLSLKKYDPVERKHLTFIQKRYK